MEETKRLYSQRAITIATYFGGPLAAGYLVKKNYLTLDKAEQANRALFFGIVSTILIFAGIFSIPENIIDKIPNMLIPAIYTGIIYLIVEKIQGKYLKEHKESGGEFHSGWKAAGVGAVCLLICGVMIAITAFIAGDLSTIKSDFDASGYDKEVAKFVENENKALKVFKELESSEPKYLVNELSNGVILWKENKKIIEKLISTKNLPSELLEQNEKLLKYCNLRILHNQLLISAISEDTDKYVSEIERIGLEINEILKQLK